MSTYQKFIFKDYDFVAESKTLKFVYSLDDAVELTETYTFDFEFVDYSPAALDRALQTAFIMVGVSYYKTYLPPEIALQKGQLDRPDADFYVKTYQRGLGEFFYLNKLDPKTPVPIPYNTDSLPPVGMPANEGILVGLGGGKDSLVSAELLRNQPKVATWSVGHKSQLQPLVERIGLPHFWVDRTWDRQLLDLNKAGAYNGHIPISAILAHIGTIVCILTGYRDIAVSNESSASEPNLVYQDVAINHQYSKSLEFEKDYQAHLQRHFGDALRYYSIARPFSELRMAELFAKTGFRKYNGAFSSCNRAYTHDQQHMFWCGECPKCAFVFMALTPFVDRQDLEAVFHGKNLLLDPTLQPTYRQLLGIEGDKPLECVGEIKENRAAMKLAQQHYPEIANLYKYELPEDYDYRAHAPHAIPPDIAQVISDI